MRKTNERRIVYCMLDDIGILETLRLPRHLFPKSANPEHKSCTPDLVRDMLIQMSHKRDFDRPGI